MKQNIQLKSILWGVAILQLFFFIDAYSQNQSLYDGGRDDRSGDQFYYDSKTDQYKLLAYDHDIPLWFDTTITFHTLSFDRGLNVVSTQKTEVPTHPGFHYYRYNKVTSSNSLLLMNRVNPTNRGYLPQTYLEHWDLCKYTPDSIKNCIKLTPDSTYGVNIFDHWFLPQNDTLYAIVECAIGTNDSIGRTILIKMDTQTTVVTHQEIELFYNGKRIFFSSGPAVHPNGNLLFTGELYDTTKKSSYAAIVEIDKNFSIVYNSFALSQGLTLKYIWVVNDKAVVYMRGVYPHSGMPNPYTYAMSMEVFDLKKDTLLKRYQFQMVRPTSDFDLGEVAGYGTHFDGERFVLSATLNEADQRNRQYKTFVFAIDTTFQLLNNISFTDSTTRFYSYVSAIIPEPDSVGNFIYEGSLAGPNINNGQFDIMWGRFKANPTGISLPEMAFRKAEVYFYPNPSSTHVDVLVDSDKIKPYQLEFYNQKGQKVMEAQTEGRKTRVAHNLAAGVYTVVATNGVNREVLSLVVE